MFGPRSRRGQVTVADGHTGHRRRATRACVAALVVLAVGNKAGDAAAPALIVNAPLLLVFLAPQARYLLLASSTVGTVPIVAVALTRRLLSVPVLYRLGALHGTGVLGWFDRRFRRLGRMMRAIERWFRRRRAPVVVAFPGGLTAFLAGDVSMPLLPLLGLTTVGLLARVSFTLWLGEVLSRPLDATLGFISDHQWQMTALTAALTALHLLHQRRRSRELATDQPALDVEVVLPDNPPADIGDLGGTVPVPVAPQPAGDTPAVTVIDLRKRFGPVEAVGGASFEVHPGEVFAFLGPNGAGKSTTIRILCTLTRPTSGRATVGGFDVMEQPQAVRRRIGLVFQDQTLDEQLTAEENLRFHAVLYGVARSEVAWRIDRVLGLVGLTDRRRDLVSTYSGGMARRLEIARALLHTPEVLFLDEPTVGLDPQTRARMWSDVLRLRDEEGSTVFFTTHYLDEAEYADRIAIIDHGRIVALDTPARLKAAVGADTVLIRTADDRLAVSHRRAARYGARPAAEGGVEVTVSDGEAAVAGIVLAADVPVQKVQVRRPTLDDVFFQFTGRQIRVETGDDLGGVRRIMKARRR